MDGPVGKVINILAIFATLFGTAASLGLIALQIGSGLAFNGWVSDLATPVLVAVLTACFIASAVSGNRRSIQWLANINKVLAVLLAVIVLISGTMSRRPSATVSSCPTQLNTLRGRSGRRRQ